MYCSDLHFVACKHLHSKIFTKTDLVFLPNKQATWKERLCSNAIRTKMVGKPLDRFKNNSEETVGFFGVRKIEQRSWVQHQCQRLILEHNLHEHLQIS